MKTRILSIFLAIVMVVLTVPTVALSAFATENTALANGSYSTTLAPGNENWPTVDGIAPTNSGYDYNLFTDKLFASVFALD